MVRLERRVLAVPAYPLVLVLRRQEITGLVGEGRVTEVDALLRVTLDERRLARCRVEQDEPDEVDITLVGNQVRLRAVLVEADRLASLEDTALVDLDEGVLVDAQDLGA